MEGEKRILYVSDYLLTEYNSVRDILMNISRENHNLGYSQSVAYFFGYSYNPLDRDTYADYTFYSACDKIDEEILGGNKYSTAQKFKYRAYKFADKIFKLLKISDKFKYFCGLKYIEKVIKTEKPDLIIFVSLSCSPRLVRMFKRYRIPYVCMLYDSLLPSPYAKEDNQSASVIENVIIQNSLAYFVPDFFYGQYRKTYRSDKIRSYHLPLLVQKKDVLQAYKTKGEGCEFAYFGQIQRFRNGDKVEEIFTRLGKKMDVFSAVPYDFSGAFISHPAVTAEELHVVVAHSKFCVAMDNSYPYNHFLPSKAYLYASFTKPVIAFGDNKESALKTFFEGYPYFYYHQFGEPLDGLMAFINEMQRVVFDEKVYEGYLCYLPKIALLPIQNVIESI